MVLTVVLVMNHHTPAAVTDTISEIRATSATRQLYNRPKSNRATTMRLAIAVVWMLSIDRSM